MSETERYVAYYRMPAVGDWLNADDLACQRRLITKYLESPDRTLVGEFTEVLSPIDDGDTSPAFDLSLECCRDHGASLICAGSPASLKTAAQSRANSLKVGIVMIGDHSPEGENQCNGQRQTQTVPHLPLGRRGTLPRLSPGTGSLHLPPAGNRAKADRFADQVRPLIEQVQAAGAATLTEIAEALNAREIRTARGRRWRPAAVKNVLNRLSEGE